MAKPEPLMVRLRLPREVADVVADRAYVARRSMNAEVVTLLCQALGMPVPVERLQNRASGARVAGTRAGVGRSGAALGSIQPDVFDYEPVDDVEPPPVKGNPQDVFTANPAATLTPERVAELQEISARLNQIFGSGGAAPAAPAAPAVKKTAPTRKGSPAPAPSKAKPARR